MNLINSFLDMAIKTDKITFTKDLAMVVDAMRGLIYRDFGMRHTSHSLIDKIVDVKTMKNGHRSAVIDYGRVVEKTKPTKPFNKELKTTILLVEQNANIALSNSDFGYVLELGRIVMEGDSSELLDKEDIKEFYLGQQDAGIRGEKRWKKKKMWR